MTTMLNGALQAALGRRFDSLPVVVNVNGVHLHIVEARVVTVNLAAPVIELATHEDGKLTDHQLAELVLDSLGDLSTALRDRLSPGEVIAFELAQHALRREVEEH